MAGAYLDGLEARIEALEACPTATKELAAAKKVETLLTLEQRKAQAQAALDALNAQVEEAQKETTEASIEAAKVEAA